MAACCVALGGASPVLPPSRPQTQRCPRPIACELDFLGLLLAKYEEVGRASTISVPLVQKEAPRHWWKGSLPESHVQLWERAGSGSEACPAPPVTLAASPVGVFSDRLGAGGP